MAIRGFEVVVVVLGLFPLLMVVDDGKLDTVVLPEAVLPVLVVPDEVDWLKAGNPKSAAAANKIAVLRQ